MKKEDVRKVIFLYNDRPHREWSPDNNAERALINSLSKWLMLARNHGGVKSFALSIVAKSSDSGSMFLWGTKDDLRRMILPAAEGLDETDDEADPEEV